MEGKIKSIRAHGKEVMGCKQFNSNVMISFQFEEEGTGAFGGDIHDIFLNEEQAKQFQKELNLRIKLNSSS